MIVYLGAPNGMYLTLDHMAYQAMARSRREASSDWADRQCAGIPERAGRRTSRRAMLFLVGVALIAMLFILAWV